MLTRQEKVDQLADLLHTHVIKPDLDRINNTGTILPTKSLRHKSTRQACAFASALTGRWFTVSIVKVSLNKLLDLEAFTLPSVPGLSESTWLNDQVSIVQELLVKAKKNANGSTDLETSSTRAGFSETLAMASMDDWETQPWPTEEDVD